MSVDALIAAYGLPALAVGAGLEGETVTVAGGLLAHQGYWSLPAAAVAASIGSFVADQGWFLAGRRFRDHLRIIQLRARPGFARALAAFERRPMLFVFGFRFVYGLRTISPIAIGTTAIPARRFLLLNALAAAVWGALFTAIGYLFGAQFEALVGRVRAHWPWLVGGALVVALAGFGWRVWRERRA